MQIPEPWFSRAVKPFVFMACLLPLAWLVWGVWQDVLGANPIEQLTRSLGEWSLRFLLLTLALTTLRRAVDWAQALRLRRMLGLYAFFYAVLHWLSYLWLDQFFDWGEIGRDLLKRPFITIGMLAFVLMIPLAATSFKAAIRKLGKNWQRLHRLMYPLSALAVLHFWWLADSKARTAMPLIYAIVLAIFLGERLWWVTRRKIALSRSRLS